MKNFKLKILTISLIAGLSGSGMVFAQTLPTSSQSVALPAPASSTPHVGTAVALTAKPSTDVPASSASSAESATATTTDSEKKVEDPSKADPDSSRFALSSQEAVDKDANLRDFIGSSENSTYESDALQTEIDLLNKRLEKLAKLTDLVQAQAKYKAVKEGKKLDAQGNPVPEKTAEEVKQAQAIVAAPKYVAPPPPKSQVIAVYGFGSNNVADTLTAGKRGEVRVGEKLNGMTVTRITEDGVYVAHGKKSTLIPVETVIDTASAGSNTGSNPSGMPMPSGAPEGFGTYSGAPVTPPSSAPTSYPNSAPQEGVSPPPLNFPAPPAPPQLTPPRPAVSGQ